MNQNETASVPAIEEQEPTQTKETWIVTQSVVFGNRRDIRDAKGQLVAGDLWPMRARSLAELHNASIERLLSTQAPPSATTKDKSLEEEEALATNTHVLQNAPTWTSAKPTQEGWYWVAMNRPDVNKTGIAVRRAMRHTPESPLRVYAGTMGWRELNDDALTLWKWSGPIAEPLDDAGETCWVKAHGTPRQLTKEEQNHE